VPRVLVIEDERKVLRSLERGLRDEGYEVVGASNGEIGYQQALNQPFDSIILDLLLPGKDGLQVLADLRKTGRRVPVLILTARDTVEDRVIGLDGGADDYLIKPFAFAELLARLRALMRRGSGEGETVLRADDLEMQLLPRRVLRAGRDISLTLREFELLEYLVRHKNAVVTREMLGRDVWKEPSHALTNAIDVFITFLRRKIEIPGKPALIHTLRGVGYSLREPNKESPVREATDPCA
jgi:two-component system, OmpR family, copper resistance phosphate regulon response regulator CusR